jgi:hypothetical protein
MHKFEGTTINEAVPEIVALQSDYKKPCLETLCAYADSVLLHMLLWTIPILLPQDITVNFSFFHIIYINLQEIRPPKGFLPGYALQSTLERDKNWEDNHYQE